VAVRGQPETADVDHVHGGGKQRDHAPLFEHGGNHGHVMEVPGAFPRIVREVDVAVEHRFPRIFIEEMLDRFRHRIDVPGRASHRLRNHAAIGQEHARGKIAGFTRRRAERGAHQRLRLLLDHGDQAVPHHLHLDVGEFCS